MEDFTSQSITEGFNVLHGLDYLQDMARRIRLLIIEMAHAAGPERRTHPGPAISIADILAGLYFEVMRIDPKNPGWEDCDRLIISKGHACPALYAALAGKFIDKRTYDVHVILGCGEVQEGLTISGRAVRSSASVRSFLQQHYRGCRR